MNLFNINSISGRLLITVLSIVVITIIVSSSMAFSELRRMAIDLAEKSATYQADSLANDLESRISLLEDSALNLALNPLIANAIVDDYGRDTYLMSFLSGITSAEGFPVDVWVTNYRGIPIASNAGADLTPEVTPWVEGLIEAALPRTQMIKIDEDFILTLAAPIIYPNTGLAEGAVVYQVRVSDWFAISQVVKLRKLNRQDSMLSLSLPGGDRKNSIMEGPAHDKDQLDISRDVFSTYQSQKGPLLVLSVHNDEAFINESLRQLLLNVVGAGLVILIIAGLITTYAVRKHLAKLRRLTDETTQLNNIRGSDATFTVDGIDEVSVLAGAFNQLLTALKTAYSELEARSAVKLAKSEQRFRSIIESSPDAILTLSQGGIIETVNPATTEIFGFSETELVGNSVNAILPPDMHVEHERYLQDSSMIQSRVINRTRDLFAVHQNGSLFPIELTVIAIEIDAEKKFVGMVRDISERKENERRLDAARDIAEKASKEKSEFLATMSHEIRTPMAGVMGLSDLLLDQDLPTDTRDKVVKIKSSTQSLLGVLNSILDISKLEAGKLELENLEFSPAQILNQCVSLFQGSNRDGIEFSVNLSDDLPTLINADLTRFRQIVVNFVNNAVKFTIEGDITVAGDITEKINGRSAIKIFVRDTGIGMSEETVEKLFNDYVQADSSIARQYEGTGLGLAICKRLVDLMGGEIGVDSKLGEGSTFWFTLPYDEVAAGHLPVQEKPAQILEDTETSPLHILVAEDSPTNQLIMKARLEKLGHTLDIVENGREAVDAHAANDYDLILMDVRMPVMSGPEATSIIRSMAENKKDIPIIACTADVMSDHISDYLKAGMNAVVGKPLDHVELVEVINRCVQESKFRVKDPAGVRPSS